MREERTNEGRKNSSIVRFLEVKKFLIRKGKLLITTTYQIRSL